MFLLARQLHADGTADRARQQQRVGGDVVGAVAAVAAGGFQPDHLDLGFRLVDQQRQVGAQDVRVLRAGPHADIAVAVIGDRAGRADRGVHLVGPDISALHRLCRRRNRGIDVALVDQRPRRRRIGAQRGLDIGEIGQDRRLLPAHLELRRRLDRILLALGDHADEIADPDHGDQAGNMFHRGFIDRNQAGADERAGIDAGIGRAHHAAVQHAGDAHVVHIDQFAGRLGRQVDARHRLADDAVGADVLHRDVFGEFKADLFAGYQFAIADAAIVLAADQAVFDGEIADRQFQPLGCARDQEIAAPAPPPFAGARR